MVIALGSNMGDRLANLRAGISALSPHVSWTRASSVYETLPVGPPDQPRFLNAVATGLCRLPPLGLLREMQRIEAALGRVRIRSQGPRTLDLDLVFYGEEVIRSPALTVPHPRWASRGFVVVPLLEIEAERIDPETGTPLRTRARETSSEGVWRFADRTALEEAF